MKMKKMLMGLISACIAMGIVMVFATSAFAVTRTFDNDSNDHKWVTDSNWSGDTEPTSSDDAIIKDGLTATVGTGDTAEAHHLYVGDEGYGKFSISGGSITVNSQTLLGNYYYGDGEFEVTGGTVNLSYLRVGDYGYYASGNFSQTGGTTKVSSQIYIDNYNNYGTFSFDGGTISFSDFTSYEPFDVIIGNGTLSATHAPGDYVAGSDTGRDMVWSGDYYLKNNATLLIDIDGDTQVDDYDLVYLHKNVIFESGSTIDFDVSVALNTGQTYDFLTYLNSYTLSGFDNLSFSNVPSGWEVNHVVAVPGTSPGLLQLNYTGGGGEIPEPLTVVSFMFITLGLAAKRLKK